MTENKRFVIDENGYLIDRDTHKLIEYDEECCNLLNELAEEREIALDGIKIADELIRKYGSDELKLTWKKEVTVKYR